MKNCKKLSFIERFLQTKLTRRKFFTNEVYQQIKNNKSKTSREKNFD